MRTLPNISSEEGAVHRTQLACLLYHTPSMELVARTVTLHLDTYSISAGKASAWVVGPGLLEGRV